MIIPYTSGTSEHEAIHLSDLAGSSVEVVVPEDTNLGDVQVCIEEAAASNSVGEFPSQPLVGGNNMLNDRKFVRVSVFRLANEFLIGVDKLYFYWYAFLFLSVLEGEAVVLGEGDGSTATLLVPASDCESTN